MSSAGGRGQLRPRRGAAAAAAAAAAATAATAAVAGSTGQQDSSESGDVEFGDASADEGGLRANRSAEDEETEGPGRGLFARSSSRAAALRAAAGLDAAPPVSDGDTDGMGEVETLSESDEGEEESDSDDDEDNGGYGYDDGNEEGVDEDGEMEEAGEEEAEEEDEGTDIVALLANVARRERLARSQLRAIAAGGVLEVESSESGEGDSDDEGAEEEVQGAGGRTAQTVMNMIRDAMIRQRQEAEGGQFGRRTREDPLAGFAKLPVEVIPLSNDLAGLCNSATTASNAQRRCAWVSW